MFINSRVLYLHEFIAVQIDSEHHILEEFLSNSIYIPNGKGNLEHGNF